MESRVSVLDLFPNPDEAERQLKAAMAIRPRSVSTLIVLATTLRTSRLDEVIALTREAVPLKPDDVLANTTLARVLADQERWEASPGKYDKALVEYREAIRLNPDNAWLYVNMAEYLQRKRDYAETLVMIRKAQDRDLKLVADPWHSDQWLAKIEPLAALDGRLPSYLKGKTIPRTLPSGWNWLGSVTTRICKSPSPGSGGGPGQSPECGGRPPGPEGLQRRLFGLAGHDEKDQGRFSARRGGEGVDFGTAPPTGPGPN
jgi:tetratricopeptide (TPR) repeat protein